MPRSITHFWVGTLESKALLDSFMKERYTANGTAHKPISRFAGSQGEDWLNHDDLEAGFEGGDGAFAEKFKGYSYAVNWMAAVEERIAAQGLSTPNTLVMCFLDGNYDPIPKPAPVNQEGIALAYLGKVEFEYDHPDWFQAILDSKGQTPPN